MQLYALDHKNRRLFVAQAQPGRDYICMECRSVVRVRTSALGKRHFFHRSLVRSCRSASKSLTHIAIQNFIQQAIGGSECEQEVAFPRIKRIADLAWHERKIVIEVQCSTISKEEVEGRITDYESLGWQVVWILYDKTFNQRFLTPAEKVLLERTHYYVSYQEKVISIYDQCGFRRDQFVIAIHELQWRKKSALDSVLGRLAHWSCMATGDVIWHIEQNTQEAKWLLERLKKPQVRTQSVGAKWTSVLRSLLRSFWHLLLEYACR